MKTLIISTSNQTTYLSIFCSWKPRFPAFNPRTVQKLNYPLSTFKPHANAKGFSGRTNSTSLESDVTNKKKTNKGKKNEDDEIPQEVFNKMIVRILVSVLVPMGLGLAILYVLGELKEQHIWDFPMWVPFSTTLLTFGASALGIAYGTLSTSLDVEREGTFLGLNEVQKNWEEMWQEEDSESSQR
ncbi:unnamed protein product [Lupinus luteus]|uniref:Uncharacterized protein n=1 Tax=Lupinus luteus TaxID=3873 RepID=A0AAV1W240_LUPLU